MNNNGWKPRKVVIIKAGAVGSAYAFALAQSKYQSFHHSANIRPAAIEPIQI